MKGEAFIKLLFNIIQSTCLFKTAKVANFNFQTIHWKLIQLKIVLKFIWQNDLLSFAPQLPYNLTGVMHQEGEALRLGAPKQ